MNLNTNMSIEEANSIFHEAMAALNSGNLERAADQFLTLLNKRPTEREFLNMCGVVNAYQGNCECALKLFNRALSLYPGDENSYFLISGLYMHLKLFRKALDVVSEGLKFTPDSRKLLPTKKLIKKLIKHPETSFVDIFNYKEYMTRISKIQKFGG